MNSTYEEIHARLREIDQALKAKNEEFANEPDTKTYPTKRLTNPPTNDLNKAKTMHKHSYKQGDNPMAMETVVREEWEKYKSGE